MELWQLERMLCGSELSISKMASISAAEDENRGDDSGSTRAARSNRRNAKSGSPHLPDDRTRQAVYGSGFRELFPRAVRPRQRPEKFERPWPKKGWPLHGSRKRGQPITRSWLGADGKRSKKCSGTRRQQTESGSRNRLRTSSKLEQKWLTFKPG